MCWVSRSPQLWFDPTNSTMWKIVPNSRITICAWIAKMQEFILQSIVCSVSKLQRMAFATKQHTWALSLVISIPMVFDAKYLPCSHSATVVHRPPLSLDYMCVPKSLIQHLSKDSLAVSKVLDELPDLRGLWSCSMWPLLDISVIMGC